MSNLEDLHFKDHTSNHGSESKSRQKTVYCVDCGESYTVPTYEHTCAICGGLYSTKKSNERPTSSSSSASTVGAGIGQPSVLPVRSRHRLSDEGIQARLMTLFQEMYGDILGETAGGSNFPNPFGTEGLSEEEMKKQKEERIEKLINRFPNETIHLNSRFLWTTTMKVIRQEHRRS